MSHHDEENDTAGRADEFLQVFKKGAEFTQDLLKENERLRFRVIKLEETLKEKGHDVVADGPEALELKKKILELEQEKGRTGSNMVT